MMTPENETNNFETVTFAVSSIDLDQEPEGRGSRTPVSEAPCLTHQFRQNMTATWGN
jgi:hypothetical protein